MFKSLQRLRPVALLSAALLIGLAPVSSAFADAGPPELSTGKIALAKHPDVSVGAQYDTTHVYVASADLDAFVNSFLATFGGKASPRAVFTVTPTPSKTASLVEDLGLGTWGHGDWGSKAKGQATESS